MTEAEIRRRVAEARVGRLGTASEAGQPHVVPFVFVLDGDTLYSAVDDKPKRSRNLKRLRNVAVNPAVSVLVDSYEEDWSRLWWVRVDGHGRIAENSERERALALLCDKYEQYRARPPSGQVLAIDVTAWRAWDGGVDSEPG